MEEKIVQMLIQKEMDNSRIAIILSFLKTEELQKQMIEIIQKNPQMSNYLLMR